MTAAKMVIYSPRQNLNINARLHLIPADLLTPTAPSGVDYVPTLHPLICMQSWEELLDYSSKTPRSHHLEKWPTGENALKLPVFHG